MNKSDLIIIGRNTAIDFGKRAVNVPAKVDTGADSSSIWASKIRVGKDGKLRFALFGENSPYYSGKVFVRENYGVALVRSSSGHQQIRYRVQLPIRIHGRRIRATFNLSDRSRNIYPVLIGRRTISTKFLVDVSQAAFVEPRPIKSAELNGELLRDPLKFHKKYHSKRRKT
jgi:hypothetical protein